MDESDFAAVPSLKTLAGRIFLQERWKYRACVLVEFACAPSAGPTGFGVAFSAQMHNPHPVLEAGRLTWVKATIG